MFSIRFTGHPFRLWARAVDGLSQRPPGRPCIGPISETSTERNQSNVATATAIRSGVEPFELHAQGDKRECERSIEPLTYRVGRLFLADHFLSWPAQFDRLRPKESSSNDDFNDARFSFHAEVNRNHVR